MLLSLSTAFIKRPVLTTVCSVLIVLIGAICIALLPLDKLPEIAPKQVRVSANYVGADAKTAIDNVTNVLERQINGTENIRWINSYTDNNGNATINVSFPTEVDRNIAQVLVQNRVGQAQSDLPAVVNQTGVTTETQSPSVTLVYAFYSDKNEQGEYIYDTRFLFNYVDRYIWNELGRIEGVGSLSAFGAANYSMRIWLDPNKLAARGLTATDVTNAISEQNIEVGAGGVGRPPTDTEQLFEIPLRVAGRFTNETEAEDIVVQVGADGTLIKIKDIGRAELGLENYATLTILDGDIPAVGLLVYQLPGSNAVETANGVKDKLAELGKTFPPGMKVANVLDSTEFIEASLRDLIITLIQAIALVVIVIFVFLQDWRSTVIPAIAIPISLIGAMIALKAFDFTLNQLTLFACVLASGLVVDDGIVIVEAVATKMEQGMRPMQASIDAMQELFGAVISTTLVLLAVFIPVSFFPGTTGIVYRQFALTIAFAMIVSTFNALTFSPSMSAIILKRATPTKGPLGWFFGLFNRGFGVVKDQYRRLIEMFTKIKILVMALFIGGLVLTGWMYQTLPQGFIPEEDQGYFFLINEAPPGVSLTHNNEINKEIMKEVMTFPQVEHAMGLAGFSFEGQSSNKGLFFVKLKPWEERSGAENSAFGVIASLNRRLNQNITGARVFAANAPPVDGLSNFSGLELFIQDRQLLGTEALINNARNVIAAANARPEIGAALTTFTFDSPILEADIDRAKAKAKNVLISDVLSTLQTYLGASFVNQFVLDGRLYRVFAQADVQFRSNPADIGNLYVRSQNGELVQMSEMVKVNQTTYPPIITNYNVYPAIKVLVNPAPGYSSGQIIQIMREITEATLQPGFDYEWTNTAADEIASAGAAPIVFGLGFIVAFLVLSAQYESYIDPLIIMLTVPLAILGALGGIWFRAALVQSSPLNPGAGIWPLLNNNIYCQVGLVMLIGMAAKNAILIVEFANQARTLGMSITKAAIYAAEQRLRPILMTAVSAIFGFLPLLIAGGAGAVSRWSLGTAVFGGLLVATVLSLLVVPNLYIVIKTFEEQFLKGGGKPSKPVAEEVQVSKS
ncbi:efflux RND transporter permease subunit [Gloeocapsa sp. PCC 73106]|uniref:efflux RND transporter permease subunit n=1 Tax=Gloeocapsa sp. PCC 73106 TaxID=102232 RepID=UPI0002ABDD06|nr:efflux RND transporter permease subunit [Gloeocapsa sp. PCC 73106]ELR97069.1 hydrophobe/amphiphile efflux-1 (HAE1) family transporter [Gloeocapsa sp. PCC 73106]